MSEDSCRKAAQDAHSRQTIECVRKRAFGAAVSQLCFYQASQNLAIALRACSKNASANSQPTLSERK